jgi:NDP-sugar pyrophosphorylase family protein
MSRGFAMGNKDTQVADLSKVTAMILAGGLGTRLRPLIKDKQKVMAEVANKPFLEHILHRLDQQGIRKAVLCTGYMSEQVKDYFGDKYGDIALSYSEEQLLLGTGGALRFALPLTDSDPLLVLNGDSFCDAELLPLLAAHIERRASASMLLTQVEDTRRYGRVDFDDDCAITKFEEKGATTGPGWINAGIYLISKNILEELPKGRNISLEKDVFANLVGRSFYVHCGKMSKFIDIGIPESIAQAQIIMQKEPSIKEIL